MKNKRGEGPRKQEMRTMRIVPNKLKTVPEMFWGNYVMEKKPNNHYGQSKNWI